MVTSTKSKKSSQKPSRSEPDTQVSLYKNPLLHNLIPCLIQVKVNGEPVVFYSLHAAIAYFRVSNVEARTAIQQSMDPFRVSRFCGKRSGAAMNPKWEAQRSEIIHKLLLAKVTQNQPVYDVLMRVTTPIQYMDEFDKFLGVNERGEGDNFIGHTLAKLAKSLKGEKRRFVPSFIL